MSRAKGEVLVLMMKHCGCESREGSDASYLDTSGMKELMSWMV